MKCTQARRSLWTSTLLPALLVASTAGSTDSSQARPTRIEVCQFGLSGVGRQASFQGTAIYRLATDAQGAIQQLEDVSVPSFMRSFLELDRFECCVRRWSLPASTQCTVSLAAGSVLSPWTIGLSCEGERSILLDLPRAASECDEGKNDG